jgi:chromosomal replication initiation ATPase DnaA
VYCNPLYDIAGKDRSQEKVFARMIYAHFCSQQGASITDIASEIRHDHNTISYYLRKFEDEYKYNPKFREIASGIENILMEKYK